MATFTVTTWFGYEEAPPAWPAGLRAQRDAVLVTLLWPRRLRPWRWTRRRCSVLGVGGDQGLDGEVVHRSGQATGDLVDQGDRVVAEQGVGPAGQLEVVAEVALGLGGVHLGHDVAQGDALIDDGWVGGWRGDPPPRQGS